MSEDWAEESYCEDSISSLASSSGTESSADEDDFDLSFDDGRGHCLANRPDMTCKDENRDSKPVGIRQKLRKLSKVIYNE